MTDLPTRLRTDADKRDYLTAGLMRAAADEIERLRRGHDHDVPACPFNDETAFHLVHDDCDAADPCPACGDIGTECNGGRPRRCPHASSPASSPIVKAGE